MSNDSTRGRSRSRARCRRRGWRRPPGRIRPGGSGSASPSRAWSGRRPTVISSSGQARPVVAQLGVAAARDSRPSAAGHRRWRRSSRSARTRASRAQTSHDRLIGDRRAGASARMSRAAPLVRRDWRKLCRKPMATARDLLRLQLPAQRARPPPRRAAAARRPWHSMRSGTVKRRSRGTSGSRLLDEHVVLLEAVLVAELERCRGSPRW